MKDLRTGLRQSGSMTVRTRTVIARLTGGAGLALAVCGGVWLHSRVPNVFGPHVSLAIPLVLPVLLLLAVILVVFAANRMRVKTATRLAILEAEVRAAVSRELASGEHSKSQGERLRLLESAVVHAHDGVVVLEARPGQERGRRVLYVNDAFCRMTGYTRDELLGRSLHQLRGPGSDPATLARIREALDSGHALKAELRNYRKDGSGFWVDLSLVPVLDPDGRVSHWVMIQRDVSDRKRAEDDLRRTSQLLRNIIDAFPGLINAKDDKTRYLLMNRGQAELYGTIPSRTVGKTVEDLVGPEAGRKVAERDREVLRTGQTVQYEETTPADADNLRPWLTTKAPLRDPAGPDGHPGPVRGVVTWSIDITALKAAQQALKAREEQLRAIGDNLPDGAVFQIVIPPGGVPRFAYISAGITRLLGLTPEQMTANPEAGYRQIHLDDLPGMREAERIAYQTVAPFDREFRQYTLTGELKWVHCRSLGTLLPDGTQVRHGLISDVTARRQAEESLRRSEGLFRGIFEGTAAGLSLTDPSGRFVSCNPAFLAMVGRSIEELQRLTTVDITHPDDRAGQIRLLDEIRAGTRDRFNYTKRYVRPNGEEVWVELSYAAIRGADGRLERGLGVSLNVTEQRRLEEQLRQAQKLEAISQMAGGIAHDFNNLLTAVLGNLALVRLPETDPNRPLLESVEQAARRAADLTRMLVGYARRNQMVTGRLVPARAFDEVVALLRRTFDPRVRIMVRVAPDCGPVLADPTLLSQTLVNLCLNARDAMPDGGTLALSADPIEVTAADTERWPDARPGAFVRLGVTDTGCGMTEEVKARLFEPFFTTKGPGKGTGLGLAMVQGIVKQHHGWLDVESSPGAGARIDLYLPAATEPAASVVETPPPRQTLPDAATTPPPVGRTILLVDDEAMIRHLGRVVLERAGYEVLMAEDGLDAVEVFIREHHRIDLVILDATMPRMSGRDAFLRMIEFDPGARVLFSTGYSAEDLSGIEGSLGLLAKPYRPDGLLTAVRDALTASTEPAASPIS